MLITIILNSDNSSSSDSNGKLTSYAEEQWKSEVRTHSGSLNYSWAHTCHLHLYIKQNNNQKNQCNSTLVMQITKKQALFWFSKDFHNLGQLAFLPTVKCLLLFFTVARIHLLGQVNILGIFYFTQLWLIHFVSF